MRYSPPPSRASTGGEELTFASHPERQFMPIDRKGPGGEELTRSHRKSKGGQSAEAEPKTLIC